MSRAMGDALKLHAATVHDGQTCGGCAHSLCCLLIRGACSRCQRGRSGGAIERQIVRHPGHELIDELTMNIRLCKYPFSDIVGRRIAAWPWLTSIVNR